MIAYWKSRMTSLTIGVALTAVQFVGPASHAAAAVLPQDPCALLKPADIQTLAPNAKIGSGVSSSTPPLGVGCTYSWGPRTREWGESAVTITIIDAAKGWVGVSPEQIQQGVLLKAKTSGPNGSQISGIGDAAVFTFEARSSNATAEAYLKAKGVHLSVAFHAGDSLAQKDKVIALLKAAAARL
jgi:hypothetical protein